MQLSSHIKLRNLLLACALLLGGPGPSAAALGNYELWHTEAQDIRLTERYTLALRESFRWQKDGDLYHQEYDIGLLRAVSENWKLGLNYRQVYTKTESEDIEDESRPQLIATWKRLLGKLSVESNNRLEYRAFEHKSPAYRYRNKFTVQFPVELSGMTFAPYAADEIFVQLNDMTFIKNRLYAGVTAGSGKISFDFYYMRQNSKNGSAWATTEALGSTVKLRF